MQLLLYRLFLAVYKFGIALASLWNNKAKQMQLGQKNVWKTINTNHQENTNTIWMHCASAGEYQQGLPVLQAIKKKFPNSRVVLTFFSPSGHHQFVKNEAVTEMYYLPLDSRINAQKWIQIVKPTIAIFVKYELWYFYLQALSANKIPTFMISMYLAPNHIFGSWYGSFHKKMLHFFSTIFVQNNESVHQLNKLGFANVILAGDTRYDRMYQIVKTNFEDTKLATFCRHKNVLIAGSTWAEDEKLLAKWWHSLLAKDNWRIIIAPHQVSEKSVAFISQLFGKNCTTYQQFSIELSQQIMILDTIGMLSKIYRYANVAYIGGGFGNGIHNILEPISYGKSVIYGPNCERFLEAEIFGRLGVAITVQNETDLQQAVDSLLANSNKNKEIIDKKFEESIGAVDVIMAAIFKNKLHIL